MRLPRLLALALALPVLLLNPQHFPGAGPWKGGPLTKKMFPSAGASSLLTNLVAYWKLDELSGTRVKTAGSCASCDLTAVNAPGPAGGAGSYALNYTATNQVVRMNDSADVSMGTSSLTACVWVRTTANTASALIDKYTTAKEYSLYLAGNGNMAWAQNNVAGLGVQALAIGRHLVCGGHHHDTGLVFTEQDGGAEVTSAHASDPDSTDTFTPAGGQSNWGTSAGATEGPAYLWKAATLTVDYAALYNSGLGYSCSALPTALRTNLIACWDLTEASGTRVASTIGSCGTPACDLTPVNTPGRAAGLVQNTMGMSAYSVSGSTMALNLNDNADISVANTTFTVACWASPSVLGNKIILDKTDEYRLGTDALNKPYAKTGTTDTATWASAATAGTWYLIAGGHRASTDTWVSVNGAARVTTAQTLAPADTANALRIFSTSIGGSYWDGAVDACGFWGKDVSDATLLALYASGTGVEYPWSSIASLFDPPTQWADRSVWQRQMAVWLRTGEVVPAFMFPSQRR